MTSNGSFPKGALTHHLVVANSISLAPPQAAGLAHSVAPPFPTKRTLRGPLMAVVSFLRQARALSEGDAASAEAYGSCVALLL